ncbi:MAG TPA: M48 family metalloprotease, partial [Acidisarcina sp.]
MRFIDDPPAEQYLEKLGAKLLAVLPPNQLHFRYKIIDSDEINAYSTAGGRIYVTRKLIAAAKCEDEMAGVLAHEMGHILTHQYGIEATAEMAQLLHVTSVGDRDDIFDKVHRMAEMEINGKWRAPSEAKGEDQADAVALYATTKAGYVPHAYTDFWDRAADTGGKTGSTLTDLFGITRPAQKRLRTMLTVERAIPPGCGATQPSVPAAFLALQREVIASSVRDQATGTESKLIQLAPPLRSDLARVQFSPDGKYVFAEDDSTIFVMLRTTLEIVLQIEAVDAEAAWFTPDSTHIVYSTPTMRVEEWDIASKQRSAVHELVIYQQCLQHLLSPDGHTMACIINTDKATRMGLMLLDVATGDTVFRKDDAFVPGFDQEDAEAIYLEKVLGTPMVSWSYTPDSTKLLVNLGHWNYLYDLNSHAMLKASGAIGKLSRGPFAFVGNDRIAIDNWDNPTSSGVYSFPEGKLLKKLAMGDQALERVTQGDYVLLRPVKDSAVGVLDLNTDRILLGMKTKAVDVYSKMLVSETGAGGVLLTTRGLVDGGTDVATRELPMSLLGGLQAAAISPDGKFLAVSSATRSGFWQVDTGKRLLYVRPFQGGFFDGNDRFYGDFSKYHQQDRSLVAIDVALGKAGKLSYSPAKNARSIGDLTVEFVLSGNREDYIHKYDLQVRDWKTNALLWTRTFAHGTPESNTMLQGKEMVLTWAIDSDAANAEMKEHPELKAQADALPKKGQGFLVEIVD